MAITNGFASPHPAIDVPLQDLPTFFFEKLKQIPAFSRENDPRPVLVDGDEDDPNKKLMLKDLEVTSTKLASGLYHKYDIRQGDMIALAAPNTIHYLVVTLAIGMLGATCLLVNPSYTAREMEYQFKGSKTKFAITGTSILSVVQDAFQNRQSILCIEQLEGVLNSQEFPRLQLTSLADLQSTPMFACYSGGTTGLPKGVLLSHHNVVSNILQCNYVLQQLDPPESLPRTSLAPLPMFHSFGLVPLAHGLPVCGSTLVIMPTFDFTKCLQLIVEHKITDTMLVQPIINAMCKFPLLSSFDLSSLRWIVSGAAPLDTETIREVQARLPQLQVLRGYGLTETSPGVALNMPDTTSPDSTGQLVPNMSAIVVDDNGNRLGPGHTGELCFKGPNIMLGYLDNPKATQDIIDAEGFLHSGDIGYIDKDDFVFVTGRKKELIKFNGFQIAPAELEGLLLQHPNVKDCAVVGVYDKKRATEVPKAFLVLSEGDKGMDVVEWMNGKVAYFKQLRGGFEVVESIPKTASGKILRRELAS